MSEPTAAEYEAFLSECGQAMTVAEPEAPPEASELEWQSRWFAGDFGRDFRTTENAEVHITHFGWWNRGAGPDFRDCVITFNGEIRRGAIELDREARDWEHHGHGANPAYDEVVLHLYLRDRGPQFFTRSSAHALVPQVHLPPPSAAAAREGLAAAKPGRCLKVFRALTAEARDRVLEAAARHRLERKGRRLRRVTAIHGADEALFQALADALGYARNRLPLTVLAQRLPLRLLRSRADEAEALLFGSAGFLEGQAFDHADEETRLWLRGLWDRWWKHRDAAPPGVPRVPVTWNVIGTRPQNHPQRRVAALWLLASRWPELRRFVSAKGFSEKELRAFLTGLSHPYWDRHYTLQASPAARPVALIGDNRVTEILANVVYPLLVPEREELWSAYRRLRAPVENEKSRRTAIRLFDGHPDIKELTSKVWRQQALLQIHEDFCLPDESGCARCPMPEQAGEEERAPVP